MKKFLTVLALAACMNVAFAQQNKTVSAAKTAAEAAQEAANNPKKAVKQATWLKLGQTMVDAYTAPMGSGWIGASEQDLQLIMANEKPKKTEKVTVMGKPFVKKVYDTKDYYFNDQGRLEMIVVTKPIYKDALGRALEAYTKANEMDVKAKKAKVIGAAVEDISKKYMDEAYNNYQLGKYEEASVNFEAAANALATAPVSKIDTSAIYNAAFTAWLTGQNERSKGLFEKCVSYGYYGEDGEAFAKLSDLRDKMGDKDGVIKGLEEGVTKYPQSQSILVGLINYYVSKGENTGRIFELLDVAKKNEPSNASLYYVEGTIHEKLGNSDAAVAAYRKCSEINPSYEFGHIGEGILFYNKAIEIQEKAQNEMDDAKYMALIGEFETALKNCIPAFEKAYELAKADDVKTSIAEYLKNACFRFRTESQEFMDKYNKYSEIVAAAKK
ncbi:MAG: hypothetical protein IJ799_07420 [Bacteroidales bacterium]|nr:hypothetical protein [Bacteroidales bacterium]